MGVLCLAINFACCEGENRHALRGASLQGAELVEEIMDLSQQACDKGDTAITQTRDIEDNLSFFGKIDASVFVKIKELVDNDMAKKTLDLAKDMDGMAVSCATKAQGMMDALQGGVDSLPEQVKVELEEETKSRAIDEDDEAELMRLLDIESDVEQVEQNTRSARKMNLFTAAKTGREQLEGVAKREVLCRTIFERIKDLGAKIWRILTAFATGGCCEQFQAVAAGAKELFECLRIGKLIKRAAEAVRRLLAAIVNFFDTIWSKFSGFLEEFDAAKKLGRFVHNLNPLNLNIGQGVSSVIGSMFG